MKRVQEKIKDLVEARGYDVVKNFTADIELTVSAYRFTDATSELLGKWLDEVAAIAYGTGGMARALAGNRGAGKSHLLTVLGAVVAHQELRARLSDSFVASRAQNLPRRALRVVRVERGTGATLADELQHALNQAFNESGEWGTNPAQMLATAVSRSDSAPLVVTIDSSPNRANRIKRDDGSYLGEMAEACRESKIFLVVALDDDISGADGVNAAIARTFQIDFLDQEHLYRILDAHIFPKKTPARPILKDIYQSLRAAIPVFNWSEQRFTALYPVHPVVADVTPAIRLYAQTFAFLSFAAESGSRALNRPAHSLIALDEIFDRAGPDLRKSEELHEAFTVYDALTVGAIGKIPIMQRLQAKLVLKALFVLSLDGRGAQASEIAAAMLITDEQYPEAAISKIVEILQIFAAAEPDGVLTRDEGETRYCLKIGASAEFEAKLGELAAEVDSPEVEAVLRNAAQARFADWVFAYEETVAADFKLEWRGTIRRGRIVWGDAVNAADMSQENLDWEVVLNLNSAPELDSSSDIPRLIWQAAPLRSEDFETLRRYAVLQKNEQLQEIFGDTVAAAKQTTSALVERIWIRSFLDEGYLWIDGIRQSFSPEARAANTLEAFTETNLSESFDRKFPAHPVFAALLSSNEVSLLVKGLFSNVDPNSATVQALAESFALPLGLVARRGDKFVLESDENLLQLRMVSSIWQLVERSDGAAVTMREVNELLKSAPFGLSRETQHLVLAALVARRRLEFVTRTGERISRRSLDFDIVWTDLNGVARSSVLPRSSTELASWAALLTDSEMPATIGDEESAAIIRQALRNWLMNWRSEQILKKFDELPDISLNVRAWRLSAHTARTFGAAAEAIESITDEQNSLEEGLERIIEAFNDSIEQFSESLGELDELRNFVDATANRERVRSYVALALTDNEQLEPLREHIWELLTASRTAFDSRANENLEDLWREFRERFAAFYVQQHDAVMRSAQLQQTLENFKTSADWAEFQNLAGLPIFNEKLLNQAFDLLDRTKDLSCAFDVRGLLRERPMCACGFRISQREKLEQTVNELRKTVEEGLRGFRRTIMGFGSALAAMVETIARGKNDSEISARAEFLAAVMRRGEELPFLMRADVEIIREALEKTAATTTLQLRVPRNFGQNTREELRGKLNYWLDNLPAAPFSIKLADGE